MGSTNPMVSIITATYNRSNVLRYTIESVIRSTVIDWEQIIVGDACTDDTEDVVASFKDSRIRFFNLKRNFGDQGGPNNEGFRYARGRYIAYLSHDDLWREDHLETVLQGIRESGVDLVFTLGISVGPDISNELLGFLPEQHNSLIKGIPASLWLAKRELIEEIGSWKHPRECRIAPSQEFLLRALRAGKRFSSIQKATVIAVQAGSRPNVYAKRDFVDNKVFFERMKGEKDFWEKELAKACVFHFHRWDNLYVLRFFRRGLLNILKGLALKKGISPIEVSHILSYGRKGAFIDRWRKNIGLNKIQ